MKNWCTVLVAFAVPLGDPSGWQNLEFRNIKPNKVEFGASGLTVKVDHSASPLIYPLPQTLSVRKIHAELEIEGELKELTEEFPEDAYLRIGLVSPGSRQLGFFERQMAPLWIKRLFALAPKNSGIDKIYFYNLTHREQWVGKSRTFPKSKDLLFETIVAAKPKGQRQMVFEHRLKEALSTSALWISIDGDNSQSTFNIRIRKLELERDTDNL